MVALANPINTFFTYLRGALPTGHRLQWIEEDTIDEIAQADKRQDNNWYLLVRGQEPNIFDLNDNRQAWHFAVSGVWSSTKDPVQVNRIGNLVAAVVRKLETDELPDGIDLVEINERVEWSQRFSLTVVEISLRVSMQLEEV